MLLERPLIMMTTLGHALMILHIARELRASISGLALASGSYTPRVPTLLCVPIMVDEADAALADAQHARAAGADIVEFRVDHVFHGEGDEAGAALIARLTRECPLPCIVTCRAAHEGGDYDGDDAGRVALYEHLGTGGTSSLPAEPPRYLDLELSTYARSPNLRQKVHLAVDWPGGTREPAPGLILSFHDFATRPPTLMRTLAEMRAFPAARVLKLAWKARSLRDNLEAFDLLRERDRPTIALCMGEFGLMSRVLAPKFGGFLTFASLRTSAATAPGQPTIAELLGLYRFRSIGPSTRVYGVIGWPVGHSRSPHVHNAGFEAVGHDGVYLPLPIPPEWEHFKATLGALLDHAPLDFRGASVTLPHKEHLIRYAREDTSRRWQIDALAERCGAGNTLVVGDDGACRIMNTDAAAAVEVIRSALPERGGDLSGLRVALLGAGGVARAVAAGLAGAGATVVVYNRTRERAERLAADLTDPKKGSITANQGRVIAAPWEKVCAACCEVHVNCTSLGMAGGPNPEAMAVDPARLEHATAATLMFDTVYNPPETPLIRSARAMGLRTATGVGMFVEQASLQFESWTGSRASRALFHTFALESAAPDTL